MSAPTRNTQLWVAWAPLVVLASSRTWAKLAASKSGLIPDFTRAHPLRKLPPGEGDPRLCPPEHRDDFEAINAVEDAFMVDAAIDDDGYPCLADLIAHGFAPHLEVPPPDHWLDRGSFEPPRGAKARMKPKHRPTGGAR